MNRESENRYFLYDVFFKALFKGNENILAKMISDITDIPYSIMEDRVIFKDNELAINKRCEKSKIGDFIKDKR